MAGVEDQAISLPGGGEGAGRALLVSTVGGGGELVGAKVGGGGELNGGGPKGRRTQIQGASQHLL